MADDLETVLTSRRAWLRAPDGWIAGRLRLSDHRLGFVGVGTAVEVDLQSITAVRVTQWPRRNLLVDTTDGTHRLRCFAMPAVAQLLFVVQEKRGQITGFS